jgi:sodium/hydrogen antiporter
VTFALAPGWHLGDLYTLALVAGGLAILGSVGTLARRGRRVFSASVFYVAVGAVGAVALSLVDVAPLDPIDDHLLLERLCEFALIVAVFSAGLTIERELRRRSLTSIALLLLVVMPLTIMAIAAFGMWAMGLSFGAALLLGAVLAPTDPVLAGDVGLSGPGGEVFGEPRLSLHTEAGFNDGLASPFVVLGLFVVEKGGVSWIGDWLVADVLFAAGVALAFGVLAGAAGAAVVTHFERQRTLSSELAAVAVVGLAVVIYGATEAVGAYGLLAVFAAGFAFRRYEFGHHVHAHVHHTSEIAGKALELLVLVTLGTMLTTAGLGIPGVKGWLLVPLLLFVIRPALVFATAGRSFLDRRARLFLGFFGVRGVAAVFYAAVVVRAHVLPAREQMIVVWTTIICVISSVVVHGLTATVLTERWLDRR